MYLVIITEKCLSKPSAVGYPPSLNWTVGTCCALGSDWHESRVILCKNHMHSKRQDHCELRDLLPL